MNSRLLYEWMERTGTTREMLAEKLGINLSTLWRNLSIRTNRRFLLAVSRVTDIPVSDLEVRVAPSDIVPIDAWRSKARVNETA